MKPCLIVISHYNVWPTTQLVALLDQIRSIPAEWPYHCRIVVNKALDKELILPERHRDIEVFYRENTGYNIGAWDFGWRQSPAYDCYLFLQEECQILRAGWLKPFVRRASDPRIGLVGESMQWAGLSWKRLDQYYNHVPLDPPIDGQPRSLTQTLRLLLERRGVSPGRTGRHLQSLVFCARREVLEATDGFLVGSGYQQAVLAEVIASKRVEAMGLRVCEVGLGAFRYILHPEWAHRRASPRQVLWRWVEPLVPVRLAMMAKEKKRRAAASAVIGEASPA